MTSLEFIEKEIKKRIDNISVWGKLLKDDPNDKFSARCLNKYKEELEVLFKIKSKLEAWEVVKKHLEYFPSDFHNGIPEEVITMTSQIDKKDYPIIKKALEVK